MIAVTSVLTVLTLGTAHARADDTTCETDCTTDPPTTDAPTTTEATTTTTEATTTTTQATTTTTVRKGGGGGSGGDTTTTTTSPSRTTTTVAGSSGETTTTTVFIYPGPLPASDNGTATGSGTGGNTSTGLMPYFGPFGTTHHRKHRTVAFLGLPPLPPTTSAPFIFVPPSTTATSAVTGRAARAEEATATLGRSGGDTARRRTLMILFVALLIGLGDIALMLGRRPAMRRRPRRKD